MPGAKDKDVHAFVKIQRDLKSGDIPSVVILRGTEQYLVSWALGRLAQAYTSEATRMLDLTEFDDDEYTISEVIRACETIPMMSERKVVVLGDFKAALGKRMPNISDSDIKELVSYIEDAPKNLLLIITLEEDKTDPEKKVGTLYKAVKKIGRVYDFTALSGSDLRKFIKKRFSSRGKQIAPAEINEIINTSGYYNKDIEYSLYNLNNDIQKIIYHTQGDSVTAADVWDCLSGSLETGVFKLIDAISLNRKDEALRLLHELVLSGRESMKILHIIVSQLEIMLQASEMSGEGISRQEIEKRLKVHSYRLQKAMAAASNYSEKKLRKMLASALNVENEIKQGYMTDELALEVFIAGI